MSKPNDNQLVFTLPEALSEIRDLRDQRREILSVLRGMKKSLGKVANELHNMDSMGQYDCRRTAADIVKAFEPAKRFLG